MAISTQSNMVTSLLKSFIRKLKQNRLCKQVQHSRICPDGEAEEKQAVENEVKEGQFAIVAAKSANEEHKAERFVVELRILKHPGFLKLLELAEQEYGFQQKGVLAVPCQPDELRRILKDMEVHSCSSSAQ